MVSLSIAILVRTGWTLDLKHLQQLLLVLPITTIPHIGAEYGHQHATIGADSEDHDESG